MTHYILNEQRQPVPVTIEEWAEWFAQPANSRVALTEIALGIAVSTVFLGLDSRQSMYDRHGHFQLPMLFETMIRGGPDDSWCERSGTWEEAVVAHEKAVLVARGTEHA